jgi:hypothetical protein
MEERRVEVLEFDAGCVVASSDATGTMAPVDSGVTAPSSVQAASGSIAGQQPSSSARLLRRCTPT